MLWTRGILRESETIATWSDFDMRQSELAYVRLREEILGWNVQPGQPLSEVETANRLGISRTPVREAMHRLAQENLIRVIPGRGAFVASISLNDVAEMFQLRDALEPVAARIAAGKPDNPKLTEFLEAFRNAPELIGAGKVAEYQALCTDMDEQIARMIENSRMESVLRSLWQEARRIRGVSRSNLPRLRESAREHEVILQAIIAHDGPAAEAATRQHLSRSFDNILNSMRDVNRSSMFV